MGDSTERFIEDEGGNVIEVKPYVLGKDIPIPLSSDVGDTVNRKFLKDNISGKFYPITFRSAILGGIGRGSSRDVIDFATYIHTNYEGVFKRTTMGNHLKYFTLSLTRKSGTLQVGDNILANNIPVTYMPEKDLVFRSMISPDTASRYTVYLSATDGRVHCFVKPLYEVMMDPMFALNPILKANEITGVAAYIE